MNRISCLIIETDQEAIRHIDILGRTIGSIEVRWKTNSLETGVGIIRKHLPEMAIVGVNEVFGDAVRHHEQAEAEFA